MAETVRVLAADDAHLEFLEMIFVRIARERKDSELPIYEIAESTLNGLTLIETYVAMKRKGETPDLITLDIEMPEADGLWALRELTARHQPHPPVVMISSLHGKELQRKYASSITKYSAQNSEMPDDKKRDLLGRVADRIRKGQIEPGKANTLIDAGLRLGFNPIDLAKFLGAKGYIVKPFKSPAQVTGVLDGAIKASNIRSLTSLAS